MAAKKNTRPIRGSAPVRDPVELNAIIRAISNLNRDELEEYGAWSDLDELSSETTFEGIEPHPDGIFETEKNHFEAIATVYVTLNYGSRKDRASMSDSYPARVAGTVAKKSDVKIDSITVDTSSFYQ
jgi:predicted pPIWI-associating nuclease